MALPAPVNPVSTFVGGNQFLNITTNNTYAVKAAPGTLVRIVINKAVIDDVFTVYDNASAASGTKIATVTLPHVLLANQFVLEYGVACSNGIVVVTASTSDITVVYS